MGDPDYWKLELLPFLVRAGRTYAIDEDLGCFATRPRDNIALLRHAGAGFGELMKAAGRALAFPARVTWLAGFELRTNFRRGASWKWPT
jgi:hypothetical protein